MNRFRSSDHDSETASSDDDAEKEAGTSKERGAKLPAWMRVGKTELEIHGEPATNTNTRPTTKFTNVNQPGIFNFFIAIKRKFFFLKISKIIILCLPIKVERIE